jgi:hypothetical protein
VEEVLELLAIGKTTPKEGAKLIQDKITALCKSLGL